MIFATMLALTGPLQAGQATWSTDPYAAPPATANIALAGSGLHVFAPTGDAPKTPPPLAAAATTINTWGLFALPARSVHQWTPVRQPTGELRYMQTIFGPYPPAYRAYLVEYGTRTATGPNGEPKGQVVNSDGSNLVTVQQGN